MANRGHKYYPSSLPAVTPGEKAEDYLTRLIPWLRDEFRDVWKDLSQTADVNVETTPTRLPYDGMMRYFINAENSSVFMPYRLVRPIELFAIRFAQTHVSRKTPLSDKGRG